MRQKSANEFQFPCSSKPVNRLLFQYKDVFYAKRLTLHDKEETFHNTHCGWRSKLADVTEGIITFSGFCGSIDPFDCNFQTNIFLSQVLNRRFAWKYTVRKDK